MNTVTLYGTEKLFQNLAQKLNRSLMTRKIRAGVKNLSDCELTTFYLERSEGALKLRRKINWKISIHQTTACQPKFFCG